MVVTELSTTLWISIIAHKQQGAAKVELWRQEALSSAVQLLRAHREGSSELTDAGALPRRGRSGM